MSEKIYVGGAKEKNGNFGPFHSISFSAEDLEVLMQNLNAKGYVNLNMNKRREPSRFGQTHSLVIDTWEPQATASQAPQPAYTPPPVPQNLAEPVTEPPFINDDDIDSCPF